jgi:hypothetical protein
MPVAANPNPIRNPLVKNIRKIKHDWSMPDEYDSSGEIA